MKIAVGIIAALSLVAMSGCAGGYAPPGGSLFTKVSLNKEIPAAGPVGGKSGTACAKSILGLLATGDASLKAAASAGGITTVKAVDYEYHALLGSVMVKVCTVAQGD